MPKATITQISFNNQQDAFAISSDDGIRIFNVDPLREVKHLKAEKVGSVRFVSLLDRTNIVAFVSGNPKPKFAPNVVMIYDLKKDKPIVEITLDSPVIGIAITATRLVVVLRMRIQLFELDAFRHTCTEETVDNKRALVAVSADKKNEILAYPGRLVGSVQVVNIQHATQNISQAPSVIRAHDNHLTHIVLNGQATIVATGSTSGTVVKLFSTKSLTLLHYLHRGLENCVFHNMRFAIDSDFLVVSSDRGTIHVYYYGHGAPTNLFSLRDRITSINKFNLPVPGVKTEVAFAPNAVTSKGKLDKDVIAIGYDGTYLRFIDSNPNVEGYECLMDLATGHEFLRF
uniref:WD_REPEATS_REGION domain-containing protein n=1 Tax=Panagrellus redivivus TaxID=6233 RepID=A0A7E4VFN3_PANRE